jgi:hypothetical protein
MGFPFRWQRFDVVAGRGGCVWSLLDDSIVFQEQAVILFGAQVLFQQSAEVVEKGQQFPVRHALDQCLHQFVVGELLQVVDQGVFIRRPIDPESDEAIKPFDKKMGVFGHLCYIPFLTRRSATGSGTGNGSI